MALQLNRLHHIHPRPRLSPILPKTFGDGLIGTWLADISAAPTSRTDDCTTTDPDIKPNSHLGRRGHPQMTALRRALGISRNGTNSSVNDTIRIKPPCHKPRCHRRLLTSLSQHLCHHGNRRSEFGLNDKAVGVSIEPPETAFVTTRCSPLCQADLPVVIGVETVERLGHCGGGLGCRHSRRRGLIGGRGGGLGGGAPADQCCRLCGDECET